MSQDRRPSDPHLDRIEAQLDNLEKAQKNLTQRNSFRKNGETWKEYMFRVVSIDRILLIGVLLYQLGGQIQMYKSKLEDLVVDRAEVVKQQQILTAQQREMQSIINAQGALTKDLIGQVSRLSNVSRNVEDQIKQMVTRREFNAAIQQRVAQPLQRIEQKVN